MYGEYYSRSGSFGGEAEMKIITKIVILALALRLLLAVVYPTSGDACGHELIVKSLIWNGGPISTLSGDPLWTPYLYHGVVAFFTYPFWVLGIFDLGILLPNLILGTLSVYILYGLVKNITQEENLSLGAAAVVALAPLHIFYSSVFYIDVPLFFFVLISLYFAQQNRSALAGIFGGIAVLVKFNGLIVLPLVGLLLLFHKQRFKFHWWKNAAIFVIFTLTIGALGNQLHKKITDATPLSWGDGSGVFGRDTLEFGFLTDPQIMQQQFFSFFAVPQGNFWESLERLPISEEFRLLLGISWIAAIILLLYPLKFVLFSRWQSRKFYMLFSWCAAILLAHIVGIALLGPVTSARYSMVILIPVSILYAQGYLLIKNSWKKYLVPAAIIIFFLPLLIQSYIAQNQVEQRHHLYEIIRALPPSAVLFGNDHCAETYTDREGIRFERSTAEMMSMHEQGKEKYILGSNRIKDDFSVIGLDPNILDNYEAVASAHDLTLFRLTKTDNFQ